MEVVPPRSIYISDNRADSTQIAESSKSMLVLKKNKKKTSQFPKYNIFNMAHYIHVYLTEKSLLLYLIPSRNILQIANKAKMFFVYWPWSELCKKRRGKKAQKPNINLLCLMLVDGKTSAKEYAA